VVKSPLRKWPCGPLKTTKVQAFGGSNPSPSASFLRHLAQSSLLDVANEIHGASKRLVVWLFVQVFWRRE